MTSAERYEIAPITLKYFSDPDVLDLDMTQMQNFQVTPAIQKSRIRAGGSVDALAFMVGRAKPQITFGTRDLATYFSQISPVNGLCLQPGSIFRELERDDCQTWTGGGMRYTVPGAGFVYPQNMNATIDDQDGVLLNSVVMPYWDKTNDPITAAYVADMTSDPVAAYVSQYFLGPVYRNGSEILGITQHGVEYGLTVTGSPKRPGPYDDTCAITDRAPTLNFTTTKSNAQVELFGECDQISFYYQKGAACDDRVPYATAEHIQISCAVGFIEVADSGGDAAADALVNVIVSPVGPLAINIASTIPLPA